MKKPASKKVEQKAEAKPAKKRSPSKSEPIKQPLKTLAKVLTRATRPEKVKGKKSDDELIAQVGAAYRAGVSVAEMADRFGVQENAICKWASKYKWKIDLRERIAQEAQRKLLANGGITDDLIVEAASNDLMMTLARHARVLSKNMDLIEQAQSQLMPVTSKDAAAVAEAALEDEEKIPLTQKVMVIKTLVDASDKVITGQRRHFKIDSAEDKNRAEIVEALAEATARLNG